METGETATAALVREVIEELGCDVVVDRWLERASRSAPPTSSVSRSAHRCRQPLAGPDHDELRWLAPDELDDVDWLEPDRPFLPTFGPSS